MNDNTASAAYSFVTGYFASGYLYGQRAHGNNFLGSAVVGTAQYSDLIASRLASLSSGGSTDLSLDGTGTSNLLIPTGSNRQWTAKVRASAFVSAVSSTTLVLGDSYAAEYTLLFKKVGGTSTLVGVNSANIISDTNMITSSFSFSVGASQDLKITFNAPDTASSDTFRTTARIELTEIAY
jgi:hypothetical protein